MSYAVLGLFCVMAGVQFDVWLRSPSPAIPRNLMALRSAELSTISYFAAVYSSQMRWLFSFRKVVSVPPSSLPFW